MKKIFLTIFAIAALIMSSCSKKIELYSDEGNTTIVYAMLDASADTNFFKITKSFIGNVYEMAQNYDANNYNENEIEVKLSGNFFKELGPNNTVITEYLNIPLNTISKWIPYDENSTFYSGCWQTYYYTTKKLAEGEEYTLSILRKEDNVTISTKTTTINSFIYQKPASSVPITFTDVTTSTANVEWRVMDAPYLSTAKYFEVTGYFRYKEFIPGAQDTVYRSIKWSLGSGKAENLFNTSTNLPYYVITYTPSALFTILGADEHLKNNSPAGVQRWFEKFEFDISAIGEDLYNYYLVTNSTSAIQDVPNYTNVTNGMGIMSARITKSLFLTISEKTRNNIVKYLPEYGFIVDPNR